MAKSPTLFPHCLLANLILVLNNVLVNSDGLTLSLIHQLSPESSFFRGDHFFNITGNIPSKNNSSIVQTLDAQNHQYIVKITIGTFKSECPPYKEYYLEMDTGSAFVWLQCEGCTKCFNQITKPFPRQASSSFHPVLVQNRTAYYEYEYADGSSTKGILARETFHLGSKAGRLTEAENLKFGCGLQNNMQYGEQRNNKIAGIMGLGWDDTSFVNQISPQSKGIFSYCLPIVSDITLTTFLRFGDAAVQQRSSRSTPLYRKNGKSPYYVDLIGISINKIRLKINPEVFAFKTNSGSGGCTIDSGTPYSRIVTPAFVVLKTELEKYFSSFKNLKKVNNPPLELCYDRSKSEGYHKILPDITFHLRGSQADFVMKPEAAFVVYGRAVENFCLAMVRDDKHSIIGSYQQTNQWYDIVRFGSSPHGFVFGHLPKGLIPIEIVSILINLMILP